MYGKLDFNPKNPHYEIPKIQNAWRPWGIKCILSVFYLALPDFSKIL